MVFVKLVVLDQVPAARLLKQVSLRAANHSHISANSNSCIAAAYHRAETILR